MFLHGIGGGALGFKYQLEVFAQAGFRAVAWNMPGYGQSDSLEDMNFPGLADAMLWLVDQLDVDTVHAVGHSIGGMVVQEFARRHQNRVIPELIAKGTSDDALGLAKACMNQITPDTYSAAMRCIVTFEGRDNLTRITRPTLVLAGDQDRNAPAPMMEKMASKIPGAEYVLLTDTGHLAPIENAQGFNSTVLEFIQRHQHGLGS